jgi:hypothetical protein
LEIVVSAAAGVSLETAAIIVKAMALGLTAVPGVAIWRGAHRLAIRIAESISPTSARPEGTMDADLAGSELIAGIFEIAIVFGAATFLLAIVAPFMSLYEGLAVMMIVVTGLAIVIWRALYWFTQLPSLFHFFCCLSGQISRPKARFNFEGIFNSTQFSPSNRDYFWRNGCGWQTSEFSME